MWCLLPWLQGRGQNGQLGTGNATDSNTPLAIAGYTFSQLAVGGYHNCGLLRSDSSAICWWGPGLLAAVHAFSVRSCTSVDE